MLNFRVKNLKKWNTVCRSITRRSCIRNCTFSQDAGVPLQRREKSSPPEQGRSGLKGAEYHRFIFSPFLHYTVQLSSPATRNTHIVSVFEHRLTPLTKSLLRNSFVSSNHCFSSIYTLDTSTVASTYLLRHNGVHHLFFTRTSTPLVRIRSLRSVRFFRGYSLHYSTFPQICARWAHSQLRWKITDLSVF